MLAYFLLKLSCINDDINMLRRWTGKKKEKVFSAPMTHLPAFTSTVILSPVRKAEIYLHTNTSNGHYT